LIVADVLMLYMAFVAAYAIRWSDDRPFAHYISPGGFSLFALASTPFWVLIFIASGLYSSRHDRGRASELGGVLLAVSGGVMLLIVFDYLRTDSPLFPSRSVPVFALGLGIVLVMTSRLFVRRGMWLLHKSGRGLRNVVMVGTGDLAQRIASDMSRPGNGFRIVGAIGVKGEQGLLSGAFPIFGSIEDALHKQDARIDEFVQADVDIPRHEITRMMSFANSRSIDYRFVPDQYGVYAAASTMSIVAGIPVMDVRLTALDGWGALGKRVFDIVSAFALILLLAPALLAIAMAIKFTDPAGPVFYRQTRLGRGGRKIGVLKFRSMRWEYSTGPNRPYKTAIEAFVAMGRADLCGEFEIDHKVANDPRVSTLGAWLRKTSLDELPQLFNALLGELSVIGPRPITQEELVRYGNQRSSFLALKPGITGLWQVSGRSSVSYDERVKLDIFYVENWSLALDMSILAKTVVTVAARRGAY
jgi:exopolysaccharide biosynthesis polyprenyl glycosylphosphotransferase